MHPHLFIAVGAALLGFGFLQSSKDRARVQSTQAKDVPVLHDKVTETNPVDPDAESSGVGHVRVLPETETTEGTE